MKWIAIVAILIFSSCSSDKKSETIHLSTSDSSKEDLLLINTGVNNEAKELTTPNYISQKVLNQHRHLTTIQGNCSSYQDYRNRLSNDSLSSIPLALDYIKTCLSSTDTSCQDSVFLSFNELFYVIANRYSESLEENYLPLIESLGNHKKSTEASALEDNLSVCGLDIFSSEGSYYLDVQSDYFYKNFQNRVSKSLSEFLKIRREELKQGFSEDAGLLISFEELYRRIKTWEQYIKTYPESIKKNEAEYYYKTYLETLMTGMDNSRVFDGEPSVLSPEIKILYQKIIKDDPESKTSKLIASYYEFLKQNNFKETDAVYEFINKNHLTSMLGVQPHLR